MNIPKLIERLRNKRIRDISCGSSHSAAITSSGELYTWGLGEYGRLGHGDNVTQLTPKLVDALSNHRIVQVACGSRDAQTLALTEEGLVFSWGDGDFGKLGRGGSEGCLIPQQIDKLTNIGIVQIECGAQFSLALSKTGEVWTWGKGDYFRLGHGSDQHVRKPTTVQGLRGKRIVHVAVGALHCLAVTDTGQVFAFGDNDHGQQGTGTTTVNKKPCPVIGLDNILINRVACGSSHSVAWSLPQYSTEDSKNEPLLFSASKDPLGSIALGFYHSETAFGSSSVKSDSKAFLSKVLVSLQSDSAKQKALNYVLNAMSIIQARQCIIAALTSHSDMAKTQSKPSANGEDAMRDLSTSQIKYYKKGVDTIVNDGGEGLVDYSVLEDGESSDLHECIDPVALLNSSNQRISFHSANISIASSASSTSDLLKEKKMTASAMSLMEATISQNEVPPYEAISDLDDISSLLKEPEVKNLIELLKIILSRDENSTSAQAIANTIILVALKNPKINLMVFEICIAELEDLCTSRFLFENSPKPVVQETSHPYIDDVTLVGHVRIPNAEALRIEFDQACSTEKRNDPLILMDGAGRVIATRSGREYAHWAPEVRIAGDEMRWKFTRYKFLYVIFGIKIELSG